MHTPSTTAIIGADPADLTAACERLSRSIGLDFGGHAVFSRHGRAILLLPVRNRRVAAATVGLYRPQTMKAKIAVAALKIANQIGALGLLPTLPGTGNDRCGALLCNPAHGTRFLAVLRKEDGELEVIKAACLADAAPLVSEHASLSRLKDRPGVPPVGDLHRTEEAVWFAMPYLGTAPASFPVALLRAWESTYREPAEDNSLIRDLLSLLDQPARTSLAGKTVRRALVHGDFAPWNWRSDDTGRLVCIDWEWAREDGFAGFDLVYCLVQQALLVKKVRTTDLDSAVRRDLARLGSEAQDIVRDSGLSLETLLSLVLAYRKFKGMENSIPGGGGATNAPPATAPKFLVLEGADGVGKSTVLRLLIPELVRRGGYRGYLFFHWKPIKGDLSYDAIPGDNPHDPRGKAPRNPLASLVFLAHHWLDFLVGHWRFVRPALRSGRLVVADRYTYDVLLDPVRFRLRLPAWVLRVFVRTLPRPDRAILLHAPPAVIRARKPELSEPEIDAYQTALLSCPLIRAPLAADASRTPQAIVDDLLRCLQPDPAQDALPETSTCPTTSREPKP